MHAVRKWFNRFWYGKPNPTYEDFEAIVVRRQPHSHHSVITRYIFKTKNGEIIKYDCNDEPQAFFLGDKVKGKILSHLRFADEAHLIDIKQ